MKPNDKVRFTVPGLHGPRRIVGFLTRPFPPGPDTWEIRAQEGGYHFVSERDLERIEQPLTFPSFEAARDFASKIPIQEIGVSWRIEDNPDGSYRIRLNPGTTPARFLTRDLKPQHRTADKEAMEKLNNDHIPPSPEQLKELRRLKGLWLDSDGTSRKAAVAFNEALAPFGEQDAHGLYFLPLG